MANRREDWTPELVRVLMDVPSGETGKVLYDPVWTDGVPGDLTKRTFEKRKAVIPVVTYLLDPARPPLPVRGDVVPLMGLWSLVIYTERAGDDFLIHAWVEV